MLNWKKTIRLAALLWLPATLSAETPVLPETVSFSEDGTFRVGGAEFMIRAYSETWAPEQNSWWKARQCELSPKGLSLRARMTVGGVPAEVSETIRPTGDGRFELDFQTRFSKPVRVNSMHGSLKLPAAGTAAIDGRTVVLPERFGGPHPVSSVETRSVTLPLAGGFRLTVSAEKPFRFLIRDGRKNGSGSLECRFHTAPDQGMIETARLNLAFRLEPVGTQPVDLRNSANSSFSDETEGDGKGGWTDQGRENDLRMIRPGRIHCGAVPFNILDAARNGGKSTIVLFGPDRIPGRTSVEIPLPPNRAGAVNLLHASAWTPVQGNPIGEIRAVWQDGTSAVIPVISRKDCGNWHGPFPTENAAVAWRAQQTGREVGLYASSFRLPKPGPEKLVLRMLDRSGVWMIPAVTLSDRPVVFTTGKAPDYIVKPGKEWIPLVYERKLTRGGPLDFSFLNDAPAGKYGAVRVSPEGTLTFERAPEKRIRFYGVNLCFSASFLSDAALTELADYLAYCGYNSVRIHHHENDMLDRRAADSLTFDPKKLDMLDRLVAAMKKRGIYITTDLYCSRKLRPGDRIPGYPTASAKQAKMLFMVEDAALENYKEFARRWMNHRNPYTGLTWGEDPAIWCVNIVNEDSIYRRFQWMGDAPGIARRCEELFTAWRNKRNLPESKPGSFNPVFRHFLNDLQAACLDKQQRFLKDELKIRPLITSVNVDEEVTLTLLRDRFEVIDNHAYFAHANYLGKNFTPPIAFTPHSAISRFAEVPRRIMPCRVAGKPYIVTEFNYCSPNRFRAEAGPLIGAYASLQNWDGLYRFSWAQGARAVYNKLGAFGFDIAGDPLAQLSDRIAMMMFRAGRVRPSETNFVCTVSPELFSGKEKDAYPEAFQKLGLIAGISSAVEKRPVRNGGKTVSLKETAQPERFADPRTAALWKKLRDTGTAESSTGELRLDQQADTFTVATPAAASVTLPKGTLSAGALRVRNADSFQTVAAVALDSEPLEKSASVLVIHLTDLSNSNLRSSDASRRLVFATGDRPLLLRRGRAEVGIAADRPFRITALNADGEKAGDVPGSLSGGRFTFQADTARFPGGVMAYHLTR